MDGLIIIYTSQNTAKLKYKHRTDSDKDHSYRLWSMIEVPNNQHLKHLTISHRSCKPNVKIEGYACQFLLVCIIHLHFKRVRTLHVNFVRTGRHSRRTCKQYENDECVLRDSTSRETKSNIKQQPFDLSSRKFQKFHHMLFLLVLCNWYRNASRSFCIIEIASWQHSINSS